MFRNVGIQNSYAGGITQKKEYNIQEKAKLLQDVVKEQKPRE